MDIIQKLIIGAPAIFFALTVHEYFHARLALHFGDPTARDQGRLTLNPLAHLDPLGTIVLFGTMLFSTFMFGWAKPVPVNPMNLRNPRVADFWISAAGPLSNLGLAFIFGSIFRASFHFGVQMPEAILVFLQISVIINCSLAFFNLIPLFPLDGSHMLASVIPDRYQATLAKIQRFSPIILLGMIYLRITSIVLGPFIALFVYLFSGITFG